MQNKFFPLAILTLVTIIHAGETAPPTSPPFVPPPQVKVQAQPVNPYAELTPLLADFQTGDDAKRAAAVKKFVEKGSIAYYLLSGLVTNPDAAISQRAKDVRAQIEKHAMQLMQEAGALQVKLQTEPLTPAVVEAVIKAWNAASAYAPQPAFRQQASQAEQMLRAQLNEMDAANKSLADSDAKLAAKPAPAGVPLSALQLERAQNFSALQRLDDAFKAAQAAAEAAGKSGRHAPAALKIMLEISLRKQDHAAVEMLCKKICAEQSDSLEAAFALGALADFYTERKRWDEAVAAVKNFMTLCPLDDSAQDSAYALLDKLMDSEHDYPRAYGLSSWLHTRLPASRLKPEILKVLAGCSEYALKDYVKAAEAYKALSEIFADIVAPADMDNALKRIKLKLDGKFPKEPAPGDDNPSAALAKFLAAVRARDGKALSAIAPAASAQAFVEALAAEGSELVPTATFADFVVHGVTLDGDKADITIDYYEASSSTPKTITEKAIKENGAWKIQWQDPDLQLNPPTPKSPKKE